LNRYSKSLEWLKRAEKIIPLGSQTFSKSRTQYPVGISPMFAQKAKGSYMWDFDNNKYIDLVSSLAAITLGYRHRGVDAAVKRQLKKGVIFSLPGRLEAEVAEQICNLVPSAEMVRFAKNGSDATSAAVRLARAYTGKNHVAVCGYHGWQDWYIGATTRNKGVPQPVSDLTHTFEFNNFESLRNLLDNNNEIGCVILEPMNFEYPKPGFLEYVREITKKLGIILVFDETITGFRFAEGGAQQLFNVTPDLSTFGKGLANGYPLSAVVGNKNIMREVEDIFFSGTFGGELLSLAAAREVLRLHEKGKVVSSLVAIGADLSSQLELLIQAKGANSFLSLSGHPTWKFLNWMPTENYSVAQLKTYFMQEMFEKNILVLNSHNVTLAMGKKEINRVIDAYEKTLSNLTKRIEEDNLVQYTKVKPLQPLFRIR
jgi:glutamate-1-semialdehyde 2,1-aminomutase